MTLKEQAIKKINPLLEKLNTQFDVKIDFNYSHEELTSIMEYYGSKKNFMDIVNSCDAEDENNKYEYTKAFLIREAVRMYLREIAPKRIKRKKS